MLHFRTTHWIIADELVNYTLKESTTCDSQSASRLRPSMDSQRPLGALGWIAAKCRDTHRAVQTVKHTWMPNCKHLKMQATVGFTWVWHLGIQPKFLSRWTSWHVKATVRAREGLQMACKIVGFPLLSKQRMMSALCIIILDRCASLGRRCGRFVSAWVHECSPCKILRLHTFAAWKWALGSKSCGTSQVSSLIAAKFLTSPRLQALPWFDPIILSK